MSQNRVVRMLGLTMLAVALLVWQMAARAGDAVVLKALSYQAVRDGYRMPKRVLPVGAIVKVLATHGTRADVTTSSGDAVSVRLEDLRMLHDAPSSAPITLQPLIVATPTPSALSSSPASSPNQTSRTQDKTGDAASPRPHEIGRRSVPVRCSHVLKNGDQCSRMTTSPNGLCWQHGGD